MAAAATTTRAAAAAAVAVGVVVIVVVVVGVVVVGVVVVVVGAVVAVVGSFSCGNGCSGSSTVKPEASARRLCIVVLACPWTERIRACIWPVNYIRARSDVERRS